MLNAWFVDDCKEGLFIYKDVCYRLQMNVNKSFLLCMGRVKCLVCR